MSIFLETPSNWTFVCAALRRLPKLGAKNDRDIKSVSRISHIHFIPIRRRYTCLLLANVSSDSCIGSKIMKVVYPACSIAPPESSRKEMIYAFWTLQPRPGPRWMLHPRPGPAVFWTLHPRPGPFWTLHPRPGPAFWRVHPRPGPCILIDLLGWVLVFGKKIVYKWM